MRTFRAIWLTALATSMVIVPATGRAATEIAKGALLVGAGACDTSPSCIAFRVVCDPALAPTLSVTSMIVDVSAYEGGSVRIRATTGEILAQQMSEDCTEVSPPGIARPGRPFTLVLTRPYLVIGASVGVVDAEYRVEPV